MARPKNDPKVVKRFSETLRRLRDERAITNIEIAHAIGVNHQSHIAQWAGGHIMPSKANQKKLAEFFDVSVSELLGFNS